MVTPDERKLIEGFRPFLNKGADPDKISLVCRCQADSLRRNGAVNVVSVAKAVNLNVFEASLPEGVSGVLDSHESAIYIERTDSGRRQRFTCAHEIGHFLLGHCRHEVVLLRSDHTNALEMDANSIAAEILMPESYVAEFIKKNSQNPEDLANQLKVSEEAAKYRITNVVNNCNKL